MHRNILNYMLHMFPRLHASAAYEASSRSLARTTPERRMSRPAGRCLRIDVCAQLKSVLPVVLEPGTSSSATICNGAKGAHPLLYCCGCTALPCTGISSIICYVCFHCYSGKCERIPGLKKHVRMRGGTVESPCMGRCKVPKWQFCPSP